MTISSSSHHHFVLCLFLLSFLCVNSQSSYIVILRNESPNHVVTEICYVNEGPDGEKILLKPGMSDHITTEKYIATDELKSEHIIWKRIS
ncbi:hypothetical protein H5410_048347 [Solanum commersonii]|uniref:Uncharacterized protein n=1 Tax=Solanum commersonii TaxID=4109 RepID=A0A9J5XHU3_SOLCO|nr:hypothetical protein H5410_048347 [Solanum commersonii]